MTTPKVPPGALDALEVTHLRSPAVEPFQAVARGTGRHSGSPQTVGPPDSTPSAATETVVGVDDVLAALQSRTGLDFSSYRRTMISRRLEQHLRRLRIGSFEEYLARLTGEPREADALIAALTIKVSRFFRDPPAFDLLRSVVLPALIERREPRSLRVWSAGCARGEEPYSVAILLAELAGAGSAPIGTVLGTDIDAAALRSARRACYTAAAVADVPESFRRRYFDPINGSCKELTVAREIRATVSFRQHSLVGKGETVDGGPFNLILCRNVLIYFDRASQLAAMQLLFDNLAPGGYLLLGDAEWPPRSLVERVQVIDRKWRVFHLTNPASSPDQGGTLGYAKR